MRYRTRFSHEHYVCPNCNEKLTKSRVQNNWKCPDCNEILSIYTTDDNHVYQRKMGQDIVKYDSVKLPSYKDSFDVLDVQYQNGKYSVALKGYTVISLKEEDWLNCIWGSWDGDVNSL
ncbi:hypothetical protein [Sporosarcina koreensis]|uniref:hypothetical protein n=1 Tax=Sporosarcina koreensis TaxID=334735 RepID=UPI000751C51A|nr:hypothetical protein [Sporosarcina koreensis]